MTMMTFLDPLRHQASALPGVPVHAAGESGFKWLADCPYKCTYKDIVCIHMHTYAQNFICITNTHIHTHADMHTCMHIAMYIHTCIHMYRYTHI